MTPPTLGLVPLPDHTVEHDFTMLARFQEYSAELLRLALLGISGLTVCLSQLLIGKRDEVELLRAAWPPARPWVVAALVALAVSAAASLLHRYLSSDSMSWHLQAMRRYHSGDPQHAARAKAETHVRLRRFRQSQWALRVAVLGLGLGAACVVGSLLVTL